MPLNGDKPGKALFFRQGVGLGQLVGKAVGNADIPHLARFYHAVEPFHHVIERGLVIPHVIDIQVNIVHAQVFQAGVHHLFDVLLAGDACVDFVLGAGQKFGGHHHSSRFAKSRSARPRYCSLVPLW